LADLHFTITPLALADALHNGAVLAQDAGGKPGVPHVLICYQDALDGAVGAVIVYGASRIVAGKTTAILDTKAPGDHASVCISRDHAEQIQSALRGYGRAKSTRVGVRISEEGYDTVEFDDDGEPIVRTVNFSIQKDGEEPLAELADSDPGGQYTRYFDMVDDFLVGAGAPLSSPVLLNFDAVKRVLNLKGLEARAVDVAATSREHVLALAAGPHFRGILADMDRYAYAGPGPDGVGRADHLLS
jgi:hypothetical protein